MSRTTVNNIACVVLLVSLGSLAGAIAAWYPPVVIAGMSVAAVAMIVEAATR